MSREDARRPSSTGSFVTSFEASGPEDEYFDARIKVLPEMIKHHVKEEEQRDGLFAHGKRASMDLEAIGHAMAVRKDELAASPADANGATMAAHRPAAVH